MKAGRGWCFHRGGGDDQCLVLRSSVLPSVVLRRTPGTARGSYVFDVEYRGRTGMRCGLDVSAKSRATAVVSAKSRATAVVWFDDRVREHSAVASAALQALADFCFTDLTLQRIEVGALAGDADKLLSPEEGTGETGGAPAIRRIGPPQHAQRPPVVAVPNPGPHLEPVPAGRRGRTIGGGPPEVLGGQRVSIHGLGQAGQQRMARLGGPPAAALEHFVERLLPPSLRPQAANDQIGQQGVRRVERRRLPEGVECRRLSRRSPFLLEDDPMREVR